MQVIQTQSLTKRFGDRAAANNLSIQVNEGEIYGFIGLNGAGKTTLIRMLLGMIRPDSGQIQLFGQPLDRHFKGWNDIGYLVETPYSYPNLSVAENLRIYYELRKLRNPAAIDQVIDQLKLSPWRNTPARHLSLGNQQRLGLAKALLHRPSLLILDEPINGLDPEGIVEIRNLLEHLAQTGTTVFISSHILDEMSKIAHRIGIIHQGNMVTELTVAQLQQQLHRKLVVQTADNAKAARRLISAGYQAALDEYHTLVLTDPKALHRPEGITKFLVENGFPPREIHCQSEDLEHYFLRMIHQ